MTEDEYLNAILQREKVDSGLSSPLWLVQTTITPTITEWANGRLIEMHPSGSFVKGTANKTGTDIDLFISLSHDTIENLKEIHDKLFRWLTGGQYTPTRQNVSQNITVLGQSVDLVPAKQQAGDPLNHSLYRRRGDTWTKTNVALHITHVRGSGCLSEIRVLKLWRDQKGLDFPSFYLELSVMRALSSGRSTSLASNVWTVFQYLSNCFETARIVDPANSNNCISDDLTDSEKAKISKAAAAALKASTWGEIVV